METHEQGALADDPSADRLGSFLVQSQMQTSVHSSALFLTAAAQNLLCMKLASELGVLVASPWVTWFKAALVPALVGIVVTPFLMYKVMQTTLVMLMLSQVLFDYEPKDKAGLAEGIRSHKHNAST